MFHLFFQCFFQKLAFFHHSNLDSPFFQPLTFLRPPNNRTTRQFKKYNFEREKVTTTNFKTSKTKNNIEKFTNHHCNKNGFLVDHYIKIDKDHYYKNQNVKKNVKRISKVSVLSDFSHFNCLWRKYLWRFWLFWC